MNLGINLKSVPLNLPDVPVVTGEACQSIPFIFVKFVICLPLATRFVYVSRQESSIAIIQAVTGGCLPNGLKNHFSPYKRSSDRLREKLLKIALLSGGNAGEKLCITLNIPVSSSTLIRLIHEQELKDPPPSEALGIDDWAFKKGINYGTAIVDLKRHKIIDLLPDRETLTV